MYTYKLTYILYEYSATSYNIKRQPVLRSVQPPIVPYKDVCRALCSLNIVHSVVIVTEDVYTPTCQCSQSRVCGHIYM